MWIDSSSDADAEPVRDLATRWPFSPYSGYRSFGLDLATPHRADLAARFVRACTATAEARVLVARDGDEVAGAALVTPQEFDSAHFGVPVHRISALVSREGGPGRTAVVQALCRELVTQASGMFLLDVDASDVHALAGAQRAGFDVFDTSLTYVTPHPRQVPDGPWQSIEVRHFDRSHPSDLSAEEVDRLAADSAAAFRQSHFHADPLLPDERCDALYGAWARNVLLGEWADWWVIAYDDDGRPQGCVGLRYSALFGPDHEPSIIGDPFGFAVHPRGRRVGSAMCHTFTRDAPGDFVENQTQVRTTPLLTIIPRMARFLRSHYVLHGWSPATALASSEVGGLP